MTPGRGWMRVLDLSVMTDATDRVRAVAPDHAAYWRDLRLGGTSRTLRDRSGLITFGAASVDEAE
jgi:hypothetical protein